MKFQRQRTRLLGIGEPCTEFLLQSLIDLYDFLYHYIENTANQNTRKVLMIRRYYTQSVLHPIVRCDLIPAEIL